jgi:hypothetical protein
MLNENLKVSTRRTIADRGTVALSNIASGEIIWKPNEKYALVSSSERVEMLRQGATDNYSQIDVELFAIDEGSEYYMNHSCEPNCMLRNRTLIAIRGIKTGEEIVYDYGVTEIFHSKSFWCKCGTPDCRVYISNLDYLDARLRRKKMEQIPEHALAASAATSNFDVIKYRLRMAMHRLKHRLLGDRPVLMWLRSGV